MGKKIYHILPVFNYRIWGSHELEKRYGYKTNQPNAGEVYNVIAMPGHLDCEVAETHEKLSDFYQSHKDLFGSDTPYMPVRAAMAATSGPMSIQVHPNDEYALKHDGRLGKPDGIYFIDGPGEMVFGHYAHTKQEFIELANTGQWDKLVRKVSVQQGEFVDIPFGTLHAFGAGLVLIEFSQNADLTYRLYDYERIEPATGKLRETHVQKVIDCVRIPNADTQKVQLTKQVKTGCLLTLFHDEPGVYSAGRIEVSKRGTFMQDEFSFIICIEGKGLIEGIEINAGETLFIPCNYGPLVIEGKIDLTYVTYRKK